MKAVSIISVVKTKTKTKQNITTKKKTKNKKHFLSSDTIVSTRDFVVILNFTVKSIYKEVGANWVKKIKNKMSLKVY